MSSALPALPAGRYDGTSTATDLPRELILTHYVTVRDGKIVSPIVTHNPPADPQPA